MRILCISAVLSVAAFAQTAPRVALEGLDPVLLIEGKESPGKQEFTFKHGRFAYQFVSAETRAQFEKDPERFGIQLGGACARMGAPTNGNPDAYHVHKGRIYIFGSQECYKRFIATPEKYLESEQPKIAWNPSPEALAGGKLALSKVLDATGGAAAIANIRGWIETRVVVSPRGEVEILRAVRRPDSVLTETVNKDFRYGEMATPSGAFQLFRGEGQPAPAEFASVIRGRAAFDLLSILTSPGPVALERDGKLSFKNGAHVTLDASNRVVTISWRGRAGDGAFGEIAISLSDYRATGGLMLPHRAEGSFNGQAEERLSYSTKAWSINPADLDTRFAPPPSR